MYCKAMHPTQCNQVRVHVMQYVAQVLSMYVCVPVPPGAAAVAMVPVSPGLCGSGPGSADSAISGRALQVGGSHHHAADKVR